MRNEWMRRGRGVDDDAGDDDYDDDFVPVKVISSKC